MPYHKNKQQAFQAAQQDFHQAIDIYKNLVEDQEDYGHHLKLLKEEINETYQQVENALEVASEAQRTQLEEYQQTLNQIMQQVNQE
ncbi:hypothetical protein [Heyndrickxia ginsengihumi]|uniref:Small, acid-soluble spore protein N n=1 Tax=Heyndrickxia ginsengihumi TaxID=363870 RepID=A0A0A6XY58_9BACI|nr:hypothetical protein [Heyndrickxia ginsengihumi]KHD85077.1 hypothetical protein NG54_11670 [Heyndrickxia ginsengihumi]MCM3024099.1 hypothetical protein [Heyndrickxia ginsengihumi]NEY21060.1 hypothetical protein [Heyndrickxia ginsengihumi]